MERPLSRAGAAPIGWDEIFQPHRSALDNEVPFLGVANLLAGQAATVLDVGCGRGGQVDNLTGRPMHDLRGPGRTVIGIDVDPAGTDNPIIDEFRLIEASGRWPVGDGEVDLAVSDYVLEHVGDPVQFVGELTRVLRPGGAFVARTVSRNSILSMAARAVPNHRHADVLKRIQPGRQARDVFPTEYRMNTKKALRALFEADYDWSLCHYSGLQHYLWPWPALARTAIAVEPRLPRGVHTTMVLYARKR